MLRRHFGISVQEYLHDVEAWEVDLLLDGLDGEHRAAAEAMKGGEHGH